MKYIKVETSEILKQFAEPDMETYRTDTGLVIMKGTADTKNGRLKHVSISRQDRYPDWDEMLMVKEFFFGNTDAMMMMPRKQNYVNVMQNCFHLWECPEKWEVQ